jgi:hypothetical protein
LNRKKSFLDITFSGAVWSLTAKTTGKDRLTAPFENAGLWMSTGYRKVCEKSREKLTPPRFK